MYPFIYLRKVLEPVDSIVSCSHAFSMDDLGTVLFVLILGNPLGLESREGGEGGTTSPDRVVSVGTSDDLDNTRLWAKFIELGVHSVWKTLVHGGSTREDDVLVEVGSDVDIALLDGVGSHSMDTLSLVTLLDKSWVEESLWAHESWGVDVHGLTIWKLVSLGELVG